MIQYTYNDTTYGSLSELRYANSNLVFPPDPSDKILSQLGIKAVTVPDPKPTAEEVAAAKLMEAKNTRNEAVSKLTVEVDGITFDGNELSQDRMTRTLLCWDPAANSISWVDSSNNIISVTRDQLQKALELSVRQMNQLWITPYNK